MNNVVLVGRLARDPELRYIPEYGTPVATFALAVDRGYTKKDGTREVDFIPIEVMGGSAEFCANYLAKGRMVSIQGQIRIEKYEKDGEKKTFTKVRTKIVNALDHKPKDEEKEISFQVLDDEDIPF
ncbi:single-stranded DNA-binding protein [Clostridioides difficile]|jgi:single-strand DNA-binding protein|uniref:Single-stranded DNA-binding protein n=2 Tax=Clostridioides difficile TaxID=1496 RepID=A0A9P3WTG1_CLODI|nr:single-stranded DNA-binding protein [Clostridioides difficile]HBR0068089.1 single-stranded DNA-binding protein [Klebsiella pneumoniae]AWH79479.1 single-stranded DNA-binding protein [Clostridioides difficile]AWH83536.1 single-stranded DNA-binding protein [Clostridioides difficile]EGT2216374.1 single-stranded DNA-binding protein [Clostridioides difficile]EGT3943840.1 single-stranded DNA-binding protein [Clostridioides difficile]